MPSNDLSQESSQEWMARSGLTALQERLGHRFQCIDLLERALTHPSVSSTTSYVGGDYERLEFLGDRVLGLVIAEMLFHRFPEEAEGKLARRHAQLVRKETLASVAGEIRLGDLMRLEMGGSELIGRNNPSLLSDACEAVIAALYLDGGLDVVKRFIADNWQHRIEADLAPPSDSKTRLQEWAQGRGLPLPKYVEVARSGPPHAPTFTIGVEVEGQRAMVGEGRSKRIAEQDAASKLLSFLEGSEV